MASQTHILTQLFVFDFDWSLADQDSDRWVLEVLAPKLRRKMETLKPDVQYTDIVAQMMVELHGFGFTREQVEHTLRVIPFHPAMVRAVRSAKARMTPASTFFCLSNANRIYIETIMKAQGILGEFDEIVTNPAEWEGDLLRIRRRLPPNGPQHTCKVGCSPNMCKGEELEAFLSRRTAVFDRIIYIGDGKNDFCPLLRMRPQDLALVRKGFGLEERIENEGKAAGLMCQTKFWGGAWEVEEIFATLV